MATSPESNAEFRITPAPRIEEGRHQAPAPAAESPASEPATQEMMVSVFHPILIQRQCQSSRMSRRSRSTSRG